MHAHVIAGYNVIPKMFDNDVVYNNMLFVNIHMALFEGVIENVVNVEKY